MTKLRKNCYFMENVKESKRLSDKVNPKEFINRFIIDHVSRNDNILDVACGPGVILNAVASEILEANFFGIDISSERISDASNYIRNTKNSFLLQANALSLPFKYDSFDFVFTRFLLEYLPNPQDVLTEMLRVCKPGGKIFFQDLDGQLQWYFPEDKYLKKRIDKVVSFLTNKTGFDPFIGRKLYYFLHSQGLINIEVKTDRYNLFWGKIDKDSLALWETKFEIVMPIMVEALGNKKEAKRLIDYCLNYFKKKESLVYSILFSVYGIKPMDYV